MYRNNRPNSLSALRLQLAWTASAIYLLSVFPAHAEAPMRTDDASTMDKGGKKIEATFGREYWEKEGELLFGMSPARNLEVEIAASDSNDGSTQDKTIALGFGAKWVPYQNETGWSLGARLDYGHREVNETPAAFNYTEHDSSLTGLASYRFSGGQALHINLGVARTQALGERDTVGTWAIGYEFPVLDRLQFTLESFGEEHAPQHSAVGLRYEIVDGLKVSAAVGRGDIHSFGQVGMAWEF